MAILNYYIGKNYPMTLYEIEIKRKRDKIRRYYIETI